MSSHPANQLGNNTILIFSLRISGKFERWQFSRISVNNWSTCIPIGKNLDTSLWVGVIPAFLFSQKTPIVLWIYLRQSFWNNFRLSRSKSSNTMVMGSFHTLDIRYCPFLQGSLYKNLLSLLSLKSSVLLFFFRHWRWQSFIQELLQQYIFWLIVVFWHFTSWV